MNSSIVQRRRLGLLGCGLLSVGLGAMLNVASTQAAEQPNIVVVMVDNYGWGEPGVYGGGALRGAPTPRIDQLAAEGIRLQNFNV
ncbi:hypothetical protein [Pseudomonas sp. IPO3749]|uniref:hypothetical protein n=1 Tax=Pseudomonas TaxID=286 RepID=UPI0026A8C5BC